MEGAGDLRVLSIGDARQEAATIASKPQMRSWPCQHAVGDVRLAQQQAEHGIRGRPAGTHTAPPFPTRSPRRCLAHATYCIIPP